MKTMKTMRPAALAVFVMIALCFPGAAAAGDGAPGMFEITPFAGYTWGGEFTDEVTGAALHIDETESYGVILDFNQDEKSQIELYLSRDPTRLKANNGTFYGNPLFNLDIDYYHIGGTYSPSEEKVRPFVVGTLGATHMIPHGSGLDSLTKFSFSLGAGVKFYATDHVGIRLEGRWFGTVFNGSGSAFCANGACAINVEGDILSQFVANAGLIVAF